LDLRAGGPDIITKEGGEKDPRAKNLKGKRKVVESNLRRQEGHSSHSGGGKRRRKAPKKMGNEKYRLVLPRGMNGNGSLSAAGKKKKKRKQRETQGERKGRSGFFQMPPNIYPGFEGKGEKEKA